MKSIQPEGILNVFKTNDERLDGVQSYIDKNFPSVSKLMAKLIANLGGQKKAISNALSLGSRSDSKDGGETELRNGIRTLLFLAFVEANQPLSAAEFLKMRYSKLKLEEIKREVDGRLPFYESNNPLRALWGGGGFTTPIHGDPPQSFRFHVFGMMNSNPVAGVVYTEILARPSLLHSFMLSTSLIDQNHRSTYYPYGFIIKAPPQSIISTRTSDQAFKNYGRFDPQNIPSLEMQNDRRAELRRVSRENDFLSPDEVLGGTRGVQGNQSYNEVVVLGTTPNGKPIEIVGMFMKTDSQGGRYQVNGAPTAFVSNDIFQMMRGTHLPIVSIRDSSGKTG